MSMTESVQLSLHGMKASEVYAATCGNMAWVTMSGPKFLATAHFKSHEEFMKFAKAVGREADKVRTIMDAEVTSDPS